MGQPFSETRNRGERKTEGGIPRPTKRHLSKCRVSTGNRDKDSPKARKTESQKLRQMDTETEKNLSTGKLRATDRSAFPECGHRTEVSGRKRKAGGALPRSPRAHSRFQSPTARKGVAGFPPLKERGAVEISHLSEARRERQVCSLRSLKCVSPWSGSRSGSSRPDSRGVGPGAALGRDDGWGLSLLLLTGARVNPNIQGPSALKAETPRNGRFAGSAGKRRTRLGPPKPSSRRGICSFPPGPSAEALRPPPPAPPHRVQGAPPQAHALPP